MTKTPDANGSNADGWLEVTEDFPDSGPATTIAPQYLSATTFDSSSTYMIDDIVTADRDPIEMSVYDGLLLTIDPSTHAIKAGNSSVFDVGLYGEWSWTETAFRSQ